MPSKRWQIICCSGGLKNDKSQFLAQAGYTELNADQLTAGIRQQLLVLNADSEEATEYASCVASLEGWQVLTVEC